MSAASYTSTSSSLTAHARDAAVDPLLKESSDTIHHGKTHSCATKGLEISKAYMVRARFKCLVGNIAPV